MAGTKMLGELCNTLAAKICNEDIASHCERFSTFVITTLDAELCKIEEFDKKFSHKISESSQAEENLLYCVEAAFIFVQSVDDFFNYGQATDFDSIKDDVRGGSPEKLLEEFMHKMSEWLKNIEKSYEDFAEQCKITSEKCLEAAESCSYQQTQAKSSKIRSRVIGGTTSTALLGGGLVTGAAAITAIAGVLTLGVGAVIGLGVVGTGLAVTGVGTAVTTGYVAKSHSNTENAFKSMSLVFRNLASNGREIKHKFTDIHLLVVRYEQNHAFLEKTMAKSKYVDTLCTALDQLKGILQLQHSTTFVAKDALTAFKIKIEK